MEIKTEVLFTTKKVICLISSRLIDYVKKEDENNEQLMKQYHILLISIVINNHINEHGHVKMNFELIQDDLIHAALKSVTVEMVKLIVMTERSVMSEAVLMEPQKQKTVVVSAKKYVQ